MKIAYVDTSCLVAIALDEPAGKETSERLSGFGRLVSSNLLEAEFRAVLAREGIEADGSALLSWIGWVHPDRPLTPEFRDVLSLGKVRGADLWHLACALLLKRRLRDLAFVTLDRRQREIATALGLAPET